MDKASAVWSFSVRKGILCYNREDVFLRGMENVL